MITSMILSRLASWRRYRQTFREQDVMRIELDMPVSDIGHCLSPDGGAVDQAEDRHERLASIGRLDQDGVAG